MPKPKSVNFPSTFSKYVLFCTFHFTFTFLNQGLIAALISFLSGLIWKASLNKCVGVYFPFFQFWCISQFWRHTYLIFNELLWKHTWYHIHPSLPKLLLYYQNYWYYCKKLNIILTVACMNYLVERCVKIAEGWKWKWHVKSAPDHSHCHFVCYPAVRWQCYIYEQTFYNIKTQLVDMIQ